jgi:hypothetical protein
MTDKDDRSADHQLEIFFQTRTLKKKFVIRCLIIQVREHIPYE